MSASPEDYDLDRFLRAQESTYHQAISELAAGKKRSHWMWYIFPQIQGLGASLMSQRYAIEGRDEAIAYLGHPVLGNRLRNCVEAMLAVKVRSAHDILGYPDDVKFHSCMTLFAAVSESGSLFHRAIDRFFDGALDEKTLCRLKR